MIEIFFWENFIFPVTLFVSLKYFQAAFQTTEVDHSNIDRLMNLDIFPKEFLVNMASTILKAVVVLWNAEISQGFDVIVPKHLLRPHRSHSVP